MRQNGHSLINMSCLGNFGVLTGFGVDVSKIFGVGVWSLIQEQERSDSPHL